MKPTIVITSAAPWSGITQRPHHIARELAHRGWDVLFVDYPITLLSPFKNRTLLHRLIPSQMIRDVTNNDDAGKLRIISPCAILPFGNLLRGMNRLNQRMVGSQIRFTNLQNCVLLATVPSSVDLIPWLHPTLVLYDCVDYHAGFPGMIRKDVVNTMERDLVHLSRVVFATAQTLADRMQFDHHDVRLVPNAAQTTHFATASTAPLHPLLATIPEPRIGYIGGIASWVNLTLLAEIARARPHAQFVMIGPIETNVEQLKSLPNVHFLGPQPYSQLPQFLRGFVATLYAFVDNELTKGVNPIKVYEYLAADKEVIATPTNELRRFEDLVWLTPSAEDAVVAMDQILLGKRKTDAESRRVFNLNNSWQARADEIERAIVEWLPSSTPL